MSVTEWDVSAIHRITQLGHVCLRDDCKWMEEGNLAHVSTQGNWLHSAATIRPFRSPHRPLNRRYSAGRKGKKNNRPEALDT